MQKIKKIIILLGIVLILTIAILIIINIKSGKRIPLDWEVIAEHEQEEALQEVDDKLDYYAIKDCVEKYYLYYMRTFNASDYYSMTFGTKSNNSEAIKEYEQKSAEVLYNMLDKEYIKSKEVTAENIKTKLGKIKISNVNITNIYISEKSESINVYIAKGMLKEENTDNRAQFQIIINVDKANRTFSIGPQEYLEEHNGIEVGKEIDIKFPESIQENNNNIFKYRKVSNENYVKDLFAKFKNEIRYYPELVYNELDEEYRNKKFASYEEFKQYIKNNEETYSKMQIKRYQKEVTEDYIQYICIDQNENYYILRETSVMKYNIMLDMYTIDSLEFIEKYDSSEYNTKVALNIEKLIEATKIHDYKYIYNKLDESFKSSNFKTLDAFEKYIKEKFNAKEDTVKYVKYEEITGVHVYHIEVTDKSENKTIKAKVVMDLKDNRDFVFSFRVEN